MYNVKGVSIVDRIWEGKFGGRVEGKELFYKVREVGDYDYGYWNMIESVFMFFKVIKISNYRNEIWKIWLGVLYIKFVYIFY